MISSLQEAASGNAEIGGSHFSTAIVELEELRHERDSLKEELNHTAAKMNSLQLEASDVEISMQSELDGLQKQIDINEEQLTQEDVNLKDLKDENAQLKTVIIFFFFCLD